MRIGLSGPSLVALLLSSLPASAACQAPSGAYVGAGAGVVLAPNVSPPPTPNVGQVITGSSVVSINWPTSSQNGNFKWVLKSVIEAIYVNPSDVTIKGLLGQTYGQVITNTGKITRSQVTFDSSTCTGTIQMLSSQAKAGSPVTTLTFTSSNNGSVVTLIDMMVESQSATYPSWHGNAYTINLQRQ